MQPERVVTLHVNLEIPLARGASPPGLDGLHVWCQGQVVDLGHSHLLGEHLVLRPCREAVADRGGHELGDVSGKIGAEDEADLREGELVDPEVDETQVVNRLKSACVPVEEAARRG